MAFVHLHCRTQYSLLDGALQPKKLASRAAELEMPAVAVTDTCNLYAAIEFYKAAKGAGVAPVFGAEMWLWPPGLDQLHAHARKQHEARDTRGPPVSSLPDGGYHLVFLVQDTAGYKNLCQLVTTAIFDGMHYRPRVDFELLQKHRDGLIVLTSGLNGPLGGAARHGEVGATGRDQARERLQRLGEIFGPDQLFVELQDFGLPGQPAVNQTGRALAAELGLQTVVTNDVRYLEPHQAVTLDLLNCIGRGEGVDDPERAVLPTDQQYFKTEAELRVLFPDDGDALDRTAELAARCTFKPHIAPPYFFPATDPPDASPPNTDDLPGSKAPRADTDANWRYFYEAFPPPRDYGLSDPSVEIPPRPEGAGSINGYFEWYAAEGLKLRLQDIPQERHEEYWARLRFELDIVENMGFPAYLLIVAEFINWAKDNEIPVGPGRGSGAGSLVNYAMRITDIDPLEFGLLMERFLNPERVSMPDIDVDFCQDRREEVIEHTRNKYGRDLVSQIITYGKLQAKAAIKDVARVCGVDFTGADRIAKLVPNELGISLEKSLQDERFAALVKGDPMVGRVVSLAQRVEGMTRQTGVHAAGVVIADRPLVEHAPLYRDGPDGGPVVQYEMKSVETVGLIKFDFLGLKTLDQLRDAVKLVERNTGEQVDLARLDPADPKVYELLQKGDSLGVFQVESSGMRELLGRLKPSNLDDLIALLALYRPGPLESGMVDNFVDCKHGRKKISYPHPSLEEILKPTYGSIVYQEQVMQIAQVYAGYSLGGADLLRRAMGKKKKEVMDEQRVTFVEGAATQGHSAEHANELFDTLTFFAGYGFNKSHSAAYGWVSYQTAWLKTHHRAEYMAALMSIEANNTDKVLLYIGDCKKAGIEVLPPDVNRSVGSFDVPADNRKQIRFGMNAVKGVGAGAVQAILQAREDAGGQFEDFGDCLERLDYHRVNKKVLEGLIKCGAFDWTGHARRALLSVLEGAMATAQQTQERKASGQTSLFGGGGASVPKVGVRVPDQGEFPMARKLAQEREALGFFITGHPIAAFKEIVARAATCTIPGLEIQQADTEVSVAGMVSAFRAVKTRRGNRMAFATVEDELGSVECVFFSEPFARSQRVLSSGQPLLIAGKLEKTGEGCKILAENAELLAEVRERRTRRVDLHVDEPELANGQVPGLAALLSASPGTCPVRLHLRVPGRGVATIKLPHQVVPDEALMEGLETLFRRSDVARLA